MPGASGSPQAAENDVTSAPFSAGAIGVGLAFSDPSFVMSCSRKAGPCRIHCGSNPSVAAVPMIGPVLLGSETTTTAFAPAVLSFWIWAVNSVSPALNVCRLTSSKPSSFAAAV